MAKMKTTLLVCIHRRFTDEASCGGRGSEGLLERLEAEVARRGLAVKVEPIRCFSRCLTGPVVRIAPGGAFFEGVTEEQIPVIVDRLAAAAEEES
ncbi:(2Fe-2S) ferredoxin domain-containing protein [Endothiovibrio diazotrophicus]